MENIIISRTVEYGSKGELLIKKEDKIIVEVVDPNSLRQIIDYAKNNFYSLKDATIDEESFSFKYGKYKVTFEFYQSHDFIRNNINLLKNKKVKKLSFLNSHDLIVNFEDTKLKLKEYDSYLEINNLLNGIRAKKQNIVYHIKGDDLYIKINGIIIELKNYKNFSTNRNFRYIFDDIKKKKFKVVKNTVLVGTLSIISAIGATSLITDVKAEDNFVYEEPKTKLETSISIPSHYEEEAFEAETTYVDSEPDTLKIIQETKTTTEAESKQSFASETKINSENDKYEELGMGSLADDEKLLTTKRLYYDLIEKYASKYGLDPDLVLAIATHERGIHSSSIDDGGAIGLMQVQVDVWKDKNLTVFDYDENKEVTIIFTMDKISNLEGNIEAGCAILQHYKNMVDNNIIALVQSYNNGPYAVDDMMDKYTRASGKTKEEINSENDLGWLDYRTSAYDGDPDYLEHVLRYYTGDIRNLEANNEKVMN